MSKTIPMFVGSLMLGACFSASAFAQTPDVYEPSLLPANPQAGHCYARVLIPAQYDTDSETVVVADEYSSVEVTQPQFEGTMQSIQTKEASVRYEVRQPRFETVNEKVLVRPAYDRLMVTPPKFDTVTETLQTSGPRRVWKLGNPGALVAQGYTIVSRADGGPNGRGYRSTTEYGAHNSGNTATRCGAGCEIWCLVEEPGESVSYNRKVLSRSAQVRRVPVSAQYTTVSKQVVSDPGGVREIPVPAEYRNLKVERQTSMGSERQVYVPAQHGQVTKRVLRAGERYEWRRVVCDPAKGRASSYGNTRSQYQGTYNQGVRSSTRSSSVYGSHSRNVAPVMPLQGNGTVSAHAAPKISVHVRSKTQSGGHTLPRRVLPSTNYQNHGVSISPKYPTSSQTHGEKPSSRRTIKSMTNGGGAYYYGSNQPVKPSGH